MNGPADGLRLVPISDELLADFRASVARFEDRVGGAVGSAGGAVGSILELTVGFILAVPRGQEWGCYLVVDDGVGLVVGSCGFKSGLDADGGVEVEIGYGTFPPHEGLGYAARMAAELIARARANGARQVFAHTLPEVNALGRVLTKAGFVRAGEAVDPDDGPVWRWERVLVG